MSPISHYRRETCRLCRSSRVKSILKLESTPPAEWFFPSSMKNKVSTFYPLELFFCLNCFHVQLLDVLNPEELFQNYFYTSESSPGLTGHFQRYAEHLVRLLEITPDSVAVDIGSNDGIFLEFLRSEGLFVIGVEPSKNLAEICRKKNLEVLNSFFTLDCAKAIEQKNGKVALITANNVFAHNDDLSSMAHTISFLLCDEGSFVFEVSSLMDTIQGLVFDYIYHEHLSYHSLTSLIPFLESHDLEVYRVESIPTKGGSLRVFAQKKSTGKRIIEDSVLLQQEKELGFGIDKLKTFSKFSREILKAKILLNSKLAELKENKRRIVGFGASATTTTLVYHFELVPLLEFLVDDNPIRWGSLLPGSDLQIEAPVRLEELHDATILILAWRFSDQIIEKYGYLKEKNGVDFIVPLPTLQIL